MRDALIGWLHPFMIGWSKYRLRNASVAMSSGLTYYLWEFLPFFKGHWQSPCTALTAGKGLPLGLCKGTVKESRHCSNKNQGPISICLYIYIQLNYSHYKKIKPLYIYNGNSYTGKIMCYKSQNILGLISIYVYHFSRYIYKDYLYKEKTVRRLS